MSKSIAKGIGIGFLSCIGIVKTTAQVLALVLVLLKSSLGIGHKKTLIKPCRDT